MLLLESNGIKWLQFELLSEFSTLSHGVLLRHGGYSLDAYASLNMGFTLDNLQENENVKRNREKVKRTFSLDGLYDCRQEHGDGIREITAHLEDRPVCDALSTSLCNKALMIAHADCQAAIFYDPVLHVVANVHAGWRGNVKNIYGKVVQHLKERYGSSPADLHVCISPSLGPEDAEFVNYRTEFPESFWEFQVKPCYFDLWSVARHQLVQAGVLNHHIQIAEINTFSNAVDYFSYRRDRVTGRHAMFAVLNDK